MALDQGTPLSEPLCGDFLQGHSLDLVKKPQAHLHSRRFDRRVQSSKGSCIHVPSLLQGTGTD